MTTTLVNPYLNGNFAPVDQEITANSLKVIGEIPPDLSGMFIRNGPNPQHPPIGEYHWFDGDGMLHGVEISNGKAIYRNRYIRTRGWNIENKAGKAVWSGLLEPPQIDNPYGPGKNTANTALVWHAGKFLALWEAGSPHNIQLPELETMGEYTYNNKLTCPFTAHPKVDPMTGEMMFFGYSFAPPYLQYGIISAEGEILKTTPIELPMGIMMHDFAITENYTIFMDLPLTFSPERMQRGEPIMMFESDRPSRFGILPRHGENSNIYWFESPSCYVFHTLNAYEAEDEIILIACRMSSTTVLETNISNKSTDPTANIPFLHRWRFHLKTGTVTEEILDDIPAEFPRVNENLIGRKTQYGYAATMANRPLPLFDGVIKYDFHHHTSQVHKFKEGHYGGEVVFAPRLNTTREDDGWLLTFVHDENSQTSELIIINAQDITSEPVAQIIIPQRVPYGFHGTWISEPQLKKYN